MATVVSQHVRHLGRHLGFFKNLFYAKVQQTLMKLVENMCLQPHIGIQLRLEPKRRIQNKFSQKFLVVYFEL